MSVFGIFYGTSKTSRVCLWLTMGFDPDLPACQRPAWQTGGRCLNLQPVASQTGLCKMPRQGPTYGRFSTMLWLSMWRGREVWKDKRKDRGVDQGLIVLIYIQKTATIQVGEGGGDEKRWPNRLKQSVPMFTFFVCPVLFPLTPPLSLPPLLYPTVTQTHSASPPPPACSPSRNRAQIEASPLKTDVSAPPFLQEQTCGVSSPTSSTQAGWPPQGLRCSHRQGDQNQHQLHQTMFFTCASNVALLSTI